MITVIQNLKKGLKSVHDAGVSHRDIKPDNVMINPNTLDVKYIDFGLSCFKDYCNVTRKIGSPIYMAPEGYLQKSCYGFNPPNDIKSWALADYWSCGLLILEFATGHHFYDWYIQNNGKCTTLEDLSDLLILNGILTTLTPRHITDLVEQYCHQYLSKTPKLMSYVIDNAVALLRLSPNRRRLMIDD
jgi:serine/threonine protein kinase